MKIVIDTNIIVADFQMKSPSFQVLLENCKQGTFQVYIPQIVKDETINKFGERLLSLKTAIGKDIKELNRSTGHIYQHVITEDQLEDEIKIYAKHLRNVIQDNKIIIIPYPKKTHKEIATRAIKKKKPFNTNGAGYRDTLIWENIKTLITQDQNILTLPELIFITNNYKDFATPEFDLHPELVIELEEQLYDPESIKIFSNLKEYIDVMAKIDLEQVKQLEKKLKNNDIDDLNLKSIITKFLLDSFVGQELNTYEVELPEEFENPTVQSVYEDFDIEEISVKKLSDSKILIDVSFELEADIDFFIYKMDYWGMNDEKKPSIFESDWNDHYMWAGDNCMLNISMTILINAELEVLSCEITTVNKHYTHEPEY